MNNRVCHIYLVRHGESEANINNINQGYLDSPLTALGEEQALEMGKSLCGINFVSIFSSDLSRARRTAEIIRRDRDIEVQTSASLRERHFGSLEGLSKSEYEKIISEGLLEFERLDSKQKWQHRIHPEIESDAEVCERFSTYLDKILEDIKGDVLIVSHRGPIRLLLAKLGTIPHENIESSKALQNTGYVKLAYHNGTLSILETHKLVGSA